MPLTMSCSGEERKIIRIGGKEETRKFLETLGFTVGTTIKVISINRGNFIVKVKESRVAIDTSLANKIMIN